MIDFHTHMLPGFDDGADFTSDSLQMARRALDLVRRIAGPRAEDLVSRWPQEILGGRAISPWEPIPPPAGKTEEKETENDNPGD